MSLSAHSQSAPATVSPAPVREGWTDDTVLLVLTWKKMEGHLPNIFRNLDMFWPGRPRTIVVTDGEWEGGEVIRRPNHSFVGLLDAAVAEVRSTIPEARYVFLMLEDLCPLAPVDESAVARAQALIRAHDKKFMAMIWPTTKDGSLRYREWAENGTLQDGTLTLLKMPQDCEFRNCLVSSTWDIAHLEGIISDKMAKGWIDPWRFELPTDGDATDHFLVEGIWPTAPDGFSVRGDINRRLVSRKHFPNSPLMSQLRRQYCGVDSLAAARLKHACQRVGRSIAKRIKTRPAVTPATKAKPTEVSE